MAPLLNYGLNSMSKQNHRNVIVLLCISNIYLGNIRLFDSSSGFSVLNFIFLYVIGSYIRKNMDINILRKKRTQSFVLYVVSSLVWGICSLVSYRYNITQWDAFAYNNICVVLASVAFFCYIMSFQFHNVFINRIAVSALAVSLIQEGLFKYSWLDHFVRLFSPLGNLLFLLLVSIIFFIISICVDNVRLFVMRPVWRLFEYGEITFAKSGLGKKMTM